MEFKKQINTSLLAWYQKNKRILPWRKDNNPYHVWISEIMLQQTRIEAVIPYYEMFIKRIPDIHTLANIDEDELLKLWEGLGYYNRARNLKKAAQMIMSECQDIFPNSYEEIIKLPGIGEYTASAIASICFYEATPTIDGNVLRVYTRIREDDRNVDLNSTKKQIRDEIRTWMDTDTGDFNEALMEIGETICLPSGEPKCYICPLNFLCKAYQHHSWIQFPVKSEKRTKKELFYTIFLFHYQNQFAIRKRDNKGLLKNLWEFPNESGKMSLTDVKYFLKQHQIHFLNVKKTISYKHIFTHQIWYMQAFEIELTNLIDAYNWVSIEELEENYAIPSAFKPFLEKIRHNIK